jgi:hypothetical protein
MELEIDLSIPKLGKRLKPRATNLNGRDRWWAPQTFKLEEAMAWLGGKLADGVRPSRFGSTAITSSMRRCLSAVINNRVGAGKWVRRCSKITRKPRRSR